MEDSKCIFLVDEDTVERVLNDAKENTKAKSKP